jgi:hypothetical protein
MNASPVMSGQSKRFRDLRNSPAIGDQNATSHPERLDHVDVLSLLALHGLIIDFTPAQPDKLTGERYMTPFGEISAENGRPVRFYRQFHGNRIGLPLEFDDLGRDQSPLCLEGETARFGRVQLKIWRDGSYSFHGSNVRDSIPYRIGGTS